MNIMHLTHLVKNSRKTRSSFPSRSGLGRKESEKDGGTYCHLTETRFNDRTRGAFSTTMWLDFFNKKKLCI